MTQKRDIIKISELVKYSYPFYFYQQKVQAQARSYGYSREVTAGALSLRQRIFYGQRISTAQA